MIVFDGLSKRFGGIQAVDKLSFEVAPGRVTGFLGPNGAGKTTTLRLATRLARADAGTVTFDGVPYTKLRRPLSRVGVALEPVVFHPGRTAADHVRMLAPYAGVGTKRCDEVLGLVGLADVAGKRVGTFSLGMRGRLNLAVALLGDPEFLLLDEPVNGLDPEGIRWIRELLRHLADEGRTVLTSSHLLTEVQQTVDEVVIIAHGALVFSGSLGDLEALNVSRTLVEATDRDALMALIERHGWTMDSAGGAHSTWALVDGVDAAQIGRAAFDAGVVITQLTSQSSGLEDTFLALTESEPASQPRPEGGPR